MAYINGKKILFSSTVNGSNGSVDLSQIENDVDMLFSAKNDHDTDIAELKSKTEGLLTAKLDKNTTADRVYAVDSLGNQYMLPYGVESSGDRSLVQRNMGGGITIKDQDIKTDTDAVNRKYVKDSVAPKSSLVLTPSDDSGVIVNIENQTESADAGVLYFNTPNSKSVRLVNISTPQNDKDAVNKKYVDDAVANAGGSGGSGGVSSWNDLTDRPFYDASVKETISRNNGSIGSSISYTTNSGEEYLATRYSEKTYTKDQLIGSVVNTTNGQYTINSSHIVEESSNGLWIKLTELEHIWVAYTTNYQPDKFSSTFPVGTYLSSYISPGGMEVICVNSLDINCTVVKCIDEKFIPDTIARKGEGGSGIEKINKVSDITNLDTFYNLRGELYNIPHLREKPKTINRIKYDTLTPELTWDGQWNGHQKYIDLSPFGYQGKFLVQMSTNVYSESELLGGAYNYFNCEDDTEYMITITSDYISYSFPGAVNYNRFVVIHDASTLCSAMGVTEGTITNGTYFMIDKGEGSQISSSGRLAYCSGIYLKPTSSESSSGGKLYKHSFLVTVEGETSIVNVELVNLSTSSTPITDATILPDFVLGTLRQVIFIIDATTSEFKQGAFLGESEGSDGNVYIGAYYINDGIIGAIPMCPPDEIGNYIDYNLYFIEEV